MSKILVIVESPNKIKKIKEILGSDYEVVASVGHIIDLDPKNMSIDFIHGYKPIYVIKEGKESVVKNLKDHSKNANIILLATDEDREGEMIAWSIAHTLKIKEAKRITFVAITKSELTNAVKKPREIDMNLVDAQKARRVLDRIIGYEISPLLRKNIGPGKLSAGRVQSVVVRLIIDRENEIKDFFQGDQNSYYRFKGLFHENGKKSFVTSLHNLDSVGSDGILKGDIAKIESETKSRELFKKFMQSKFKVANIFNKKSLRSPAAPFTTSTLQQEASRKLGMTVQRTMSAAQHLYEAGYITYMRTDSINLSVEALDNLKDYIIKTYGEGFYRKMIYKAKTKNTQEAHEAIRPTDAFVESVDVNGKIKDDERRLYSLIWKRTVASQMKPAEYNVTTIQISISKDSEHFFSTSVDNLVFSGYLKVYNIENIEKEDTEDGSENKEIPVPKAGKELLVTSIVSTQEYEKPPTRYNEASLVDKLDPKNLNIGRPSTYAFIINTILDRGYVKKEDISGFERDSLTLTWNGKDKIEEDIKKIIIGKENNKFVPTSLGNVVNTFLMSAFPKIMDYKFTANMEEQLDEIAEGKLKYVYVVDNFYKEFHPLVEKYIKEKSLVEEKYTKKLGKDPTGAEIIATIAKFGPVVKLISPSSSKPIYAPIKEPLTLETITLDDALKLFEYPKFLGKYKNKNIILNKGQYGLYITYGKDRYAIEEGKTDVSLEDAEKIIESKKPLVEFKTENKVYSVLKGPTGNYIKIVDNSKKHMKKTYTVSLPLDIDIKTLTIEKIQNIIEEHWLKQKQKWKKKDTKNEITSASGGKQIIKKKVSKKKIIKKKSIKKKSIKKSIKKKLIKKTK